MTATSNAVIASIPALQYSCDACARPIHGERYHCQECPDYDLCPRCYKQRGERCDSGHVFFACELQSFTEVRSNCIRKAGHGIGHMMRTAMRMWPDRPCIGVKARGRFATPLHRDGSPYQYVRVSAIHRRAMLLLRGLHRELMSGGEHGFDPEEAKAEYHYDPLDAEPMRVAILMPNSVDWTVCDVALAFGGFTSVPLDTAATRDTLVHILRITNARVVLTTDDLVRSRLAELTREELPDLKFIVTMPTEDNDYLEKEHPEDVHDDGSTGDEAASPIDHDHDNVAASDHGRSAPWPILPRRNIVAPFRTTPIAMTLREKDSLDDSLLMPTREPNDVFTLLFTSGSTGKPKGAITTHGGWSYCTFEVILMRSPLVSCVYRPLCYATDREITWRALANGGRFALFRGEIDTIFDELNLIRPTAFSAPPRVWNLLFTRFEAQLKDRVKDALKKIDNPDPAWNESVRAAARVKLLQEYGRATVGDRCELVGVGGARSRPEVMQFLKEVYKNSGRVYDSYGTTENGGISVDGSIPSSAKVKLIDVPEMGFLTSNSPPQGEVCVITPDGIPGYWRDEENTAALFHTDEKGVKWHRTGDIGEKGADGRLTLIDRRSNLVKLNTSVFISPEFLETTFANAPSVRDVFVYAESSWDFPLAVVSPRGDPATALEPDAVLREIREIVAKQQIPPTHVPHGVIVTHEWFSVENRLLTISVKLSRPNLRAKFQADLRSLYAELSGQADPAATTADDTMMGVQRQSSSVIFGGGGAASGGTPASAAGTTDAGLSEMVAVLTKVFKKALMFPSISPTDSCESLQAGSIAVASLRARIRRATGVTVGMEPLWTNTIDELAKAILAERRGAGGSFAELEADGDKADAQAGLNVGDDDAAATTSGGKKKSRVDAGVVSAQGSQQLADMLRTDSVYKPRQTAVKPDQTRVALLTGATGFIGSHVLHSVILRIRQRRTGVAVDDDFDVIDRIVCLVRSPSGDGCARLRDSCAFKGQKTALRLLNELIDDGTVSVVLGDLETRRPANQDDDQPSAAPFGLNSTDAETLRTSVTDVLHCGAMVNHVMPYSVLAPANVHAVRDLIDLVGGPSSRLVRFALVSTASVVPLTETGNDAIPSDPIAAPAPALLQRLDPSGYQLSKWAAETLLHSAVKAGQFPRDCRFIVHRVGMASWSSATGVGNAADWLTALAQATAILEAYPAAARGGRTLNLVPVDWVSDVIAFAAGDPFRPNAVGGGAHRGTSSTGGGAGGSSNSAAYQRRTLTTTHLISPFAFDIQPTLNALASSAAGTPRWPLSDDEWCAKLTTAALSPEEYTDSDRCGRMLATAALFFGTRLPASEDGVRVPSTLHNVPSALDPQTDPRLKPAGGVGWCDKAANTAPTPHLGFVSWIQRQIVRKTAGGSP